MRFQLFIPGPTEVREEVLRAQAQPMIGHRMPEFSDLFHRVTEKIRTLFKTDAHVLIFTSSATGVMEGAVRNVVQHRLLSTVNGAFSERWAKIAKANGKAVDVLEVAWGQAIKPEALAEALKRKPYEAVLITHNETSTGVMNPLKDLAKVVHEVSPDTLILVDAVSSMIGAPIEFDAWGLDVVLASVQKCFALPPGLTVTLVSHRAIEKAKTVEHRGYYFDFLTQLKYYEERHQTPATPAISLLYALDVQLDRIQAETLEKRYERHQKMAEMARSWARTYFELFPEPGYESPTVTTIRNTRGISVKDTLQELKKRGYAISNGYGKLKEKTFRIGHMGDLTPDELQRLLETLTEVLGLPQA